VRRKSGSSLRVAGVVLGVAVLIASAVFVAQTVDAETLRRVGSALLADPAGLALALFAYAGAFALRAWAWQRSLPGLPACQAWAALHVSLLGNHVLPLRLGEALRVTSVMRRTTMPVGPVTASALTLRAADVLAVLALPAVAAPAVLTMYGTWAVLVTAIAVGGALGGLAWVRRLRSAGASVRLPGAGPLAATTLAWMLEAAVVWEVAGVAGIHLTLWQAVVVTAATIAAQTVAVTPGGFGTYEAAATAAMVAIGVPAGAAFAVALTTHAVKTGYALVLGAYALVRPVPGYWGRFRLPRRRPPRPLPWPPGPDALVVVIVPVHDEEATVADVVRGLPRTVQDRRVVTLVVDDGSTDRSAQLAREAGAVVVAQPRNLGLGAAVRRGLAEATALDPAAVVYLDADLEYDPAQAERLAAPVLDGSADYVVGSRFAGDIRRMLPQRRMGNLVLTRWVRWMARLPVTDGQSGYRAFSPRAAAEAEIIHDYNYAQVLTLNLVGRGFVYREVPIGYEFRASGTSFVRLGRYLRRVLPAVRRELERSAGSVLDDVTVEPLAGRRPRVTVEPAVVTEGVDGVVGHDQGVVGVVMGEQALPAERHHPPQHPGPRVDAGQIVLEADPVHRVDLPEPARLDVQAVHRG
jgi:uncharacterized membrane protein YbhN (UPF0104 family)